MATIATPHVWLDERQVAWVDDTNIKVIEIALDNLSHGWSAEEIHYQHYRGLTMGQIYAALTYYHDHQEEFDAQIEQQLRESDELRSKFVDSPGRQRLRGTGKKLP